MDDDVASFFLIEQTTKLATIPNFMYCNISFCVIWCCIEEEDVDDECEPCPNPEDAEEEKDEKVEELELWFPEKEDDEEEKEENEEDVDDDDEYIPPCALFSCCENSNSV